MVVANPNHHRAEKITEDIQLPVIDLLSDPSQSSKHIVKACEQFGFFKVINHGVPPEIISRMEQESLDFFSKPGCEKLRTGPANPYGYGCKSIGLNGDIGEVEYLLLQANPHIVSQNSLYISGDPNKFRCAVNGYVEALRKLACEILDLMARGLGLGLGLGSPQVSTSVLSGLIRDVVNTDSLLRLNHYPPVEAASKIGFGEHTDPQILTLLRSNGVGGLQISLEDGVWIPVNPHPVSAFCVNVGDVLQVMTNGRFLSVRHRAMVNSFETRMSMAYFAAPSMDTTICCLPELATPQKPSLYKTFTWGEYKKAAYTRRLGDSRLNLFKMKQDD
ncbi:gibberellin 2-beta-dioxygenase 2 [Primulina eburnea]|uniref:gibberellin 2-beta-dioxygenase 2 n=1 Tax=Primulina eburnea TaxID=1245227 RepID=UPI003C6C8251